jgi:hypothetical protein
MFHSGRHKGFICDMTSIQNVDMLTQLPGRMSGAKIFVRPEEVCDLVL